MLQRIMEELLARIELHCTFQIFKSLAQHEKQANMSSVEGAEAPYDVLVIGSGVVGANIARELSKYDKCRVAVLEKELDVGLGGASKANSGIVHGGYDATLGSLKSSLGRQGNLMFEKLNAELNFGYEKVGSLVLAFKQEENSKLEELLENGKHLGIEDMRIISGDEARVLEPSLSLGVYSALLCESAGVCQPYEFAIALMENTVANGVELFLGHEVVGISWDKAKQVYHVQTKQGKTFQSRWVVNAAGLYSDVINRMVDPLSSFTIVPRKGEYVLLAKSQGKITQRVIFQTPTARWGKGVLVARTVAGNILIGPSAKEQESRTEVDTNQGELAYVMWAARKSIPHLDSKEAIRSFAGLRARASNTADFIINQVKPRFITCGAIDSPGLTASPAIALQVIDMFQESGLKLQLKTNFNPIRKPYASSSSSTLLCKCEMVMESEVKDAIHRGIPIHSTDAIKYRTRCGMGHCQGQRCQKQVAKVIEQETGRAVPKSTLHEHERLPRDILSKL
jgi:glycerol-3-phosphate dehydrogenase